MLKYMICFSIRLKCNVSSSQTFMFFFSFHSSLLNVFWMRTYSCNLNPFSVSVRPISLGLAQYLPTKLEAWKHMAWPFLAPVFFFLATFWPFGETLKTQWTPSSSLSPCLHEEYECHGDAAAMPCQANTGDLARDNQTDGRMLHRR